MPDSRPDGERDLERELRDLGSRIEYPPTPGLARTARLRLEAEANEDAERAARRGRFWLPALSPRWAVAAMFVVVLAVPALSPAARESLSGLLVVGGGASYSGGGAAQSAGDADDSAAGKAEPQDMAAGESGGQNAPAGAGEAMPESASGGQAESAASSSAEAAVGFGAERITLREARIRAREDRPVLLPQGPAAGLPDAVYEIWAPYGNGLAFVYQTRPGLPALGDTGIGMVLTETPGSLQATYLPNISNDTSLEEVNVGGRRGYWVPRARLDPLSSGRTSSGQSGRPLVNVLLWEQEGLSLRLESNLTREEAIRIAESVR